MLAQVCLLKTYINALPARNVARPPRFAISEQQPVLRSRQTQYSLSESDPSYILLVRGREGKGGIGCSCGGDSLDAYTPVLKAKS
jgi:hypothetical protein